MKRKENSLIRRYKQNYGIPDDVDVSEKMIMAHWELEQQLTSELLRSTPENRWKTFDQCYTRLYTKLKWLNPPFEKSDPAATPERFREWLEVIGPPPKSVYEIGSGRGELISCLARQNFECKGTDITRERGRIHAVCPQQQLSWGISDGVHLDDFEPPESYEVVVSNQVIEHLHPADIGAHFRGAHRLLKSGGCYFLSTPHRYTGPHDVSRVFGLDRARGMHLKEYTYQELVDVIRRAGYSRIYSAYPPKKLRRFLRLLGIGSTASSKGPELLYLRALLLSERILSVIPAPRLRRLCASVFEKFRLFSGNIFLAAEKASATSTALDT